LSTLPRIELLILVAALLGGCGDKVPQSQAAKKIGAIPKATVDRATADTNKALQQGADRSREAEEKK
jgi:hypothetical protein